MSQVVLDQWVLQDQPLSTAHDYDSSQDWLDYTVYT